MIYETLLIDIISIGIDIKPIPRKCHIVIELFLFVFITATTRRVRRGENSNTNVIYETRGNKRRESTATNRRHSSVRRGSQYHEVHVAMLPDLSGKFDR